MIATRRGKPRYLPLYLTFWSTQFSVVVSGVLGGVYPLGRCQSWAFRSGAGPKVLWLRHILGGSGMINCHDLRVATKNRLMEYDMNIFWSDCYFLTTEIPEILVPLWKHTFHWSFRGSSPRYKGTKQHKRCWSTSELSIIGHWRNIPLSLNLYLCIYIYVLSII